VKYRTQFNYHGTRVDKSKVKSPIVEFTPLASAQLELILSHDHTLENMWLRLVVSGKGCDGFDYSVGFTEYQEDDFQIAIQLNQDKQTFVLIDPFTAFYLQHSKIDYVQDFINDEEGFVVKNIEQDEFKGKFWRTEQEKTPPLLKQS
jgi:iron-sulfur cluster insertion protein